MTERRQFRDLATPSELRSTIAGLDIEAGTEQVPLAAAGGRVLGERVDASIDVPGFDRAAMDGYAVRAGDTVGATERDPVTLERAGAIHAGERPSDRVEPGTAVEIATGAVVPPGADAVVMVERTETVDGDIAVRTAVAPGDHVMAAGADVAAGQRAIGPGTRLTPREIGLLAAVGVEDVSVVGRPTVGVISTGDELVEPGTDLDPAAGQIYDVNGVAISTAIAEAGGDPVRYSTVGDDPDAMAARIREAARECDLVCTSGSTSASAMDVVYHVLESAGERLVHGVAVKPGKPTLVGRIDGTPFVGLPGYPVSALTIFRTFVAPAVREAAGLAEARTTTVEATMAVTERFSEGRHRLLPVGLVDGGGGGSDGRPRAYPVDRGSGATTTLVDADGVVAVPAQTDYLADGEQVTVELFSAAVRPPRLLVVGEDDPLVGTLIDRIDRPRYLVRGSRGGLRSLRDGVADAAVVSGPVEPDDDVDPIAAWTREWGLVVPDGNPDAVGGLQDLVDRDLSFVNRDSESGLAATLDAALAAMATADDRDEGSLREAIRDYTLTTRAHESPARRVARGDADAGLGLSATADRLGLGFVSLGTEPVRVLAATDRRDTAPVREFRTLFENASEEVVDDLVGFEQ